MLYGTQKLRLFKYMDEGQKYVFLNPSSNDAIGFNIPTYDAASLSDLCPKDIKEYFSSIVISLVSYL